MAKDETIEGKINDLFVYLLLHYDKVDDKHRLVHETRIDTKAKRLIGFGIVSCYWAIVLTKQCGTMWATNMKAHICRITSIETMAVNTPLELRILD